MKLLSGNQFFHDSVASDFYGFTWIFGQPKLGTNSNSKFRALRPVFLLRMPLILGPLPVPAIRAAIFASDSSRVERNQRNPGKGQIIGQKRNLSRFKYIYIYIYIITKNIMYVYIYICIYCIYTVYIY